MMTRILLILLSLIIKLLVDLPLMLAGYLVFWPAYRQREIKLDRDGRTVWHFPRWAWLWDNANHGIDGQRFWRSRTVGWSEWRRCFVWSIVRNPTFNWCKFILGFPSRGEARVVAGATYPIGDTKAEGWYWARERWAWEFYFVKAYTLFGQRRCLRFRAGWKILNKDPGERAQFVFAPSPFHSYTGK